MHITRLDIENFGPFHGLTLTAFSPRLTLIHGPNEAGKSALRAFVRAVFFGYLHSNEKEYGFYHYAPVLGGTASGSVGVRMSDGAAYTVHRKKGPKRGPVLVTPDSPRGVNGGRQGNPAGSAAARGGSEMLDELLGGISPEYYQNVFSISLGELQSFETLNQPQIRDRIYSVGLGLGKVSLPDAFETLDKDLKVPRAGIKAAGKEIADLRSQIESARIEAGGYAGMVALKSQLDHKVTQSRDARAEIRKLIARQERLIDLHPQWKGMQELERRLDGAPDMPSFPASGEKQLDEALRQLADMEKLVQEGDLRQQARASQLKAAPVVEAFSRSDNEVKRLLGELEHYRKAVEDLPLREQELDNDQTRLTGDLELLGPDWTEQRVVEFKVPSDFKARMDQAARAISATREALHEANSDVRRNTDEHQRDAGAHLNAEAHRDALKDVPTEGIADLETHSDRLRGLKTAMADATATETERREVERRLSEALVRVQPQAANHLPGAAWTGVIIIALGLAAVGYAVWKMELAGAIPGGLAVLAGALTLGRAIITSKGMKAVLTPRESGSPVDVLKKQFEALGAMVEANRQEVASRVSEAQLPGTPTVRQIEEQLASAGRGMDRRRTFETLSTRAREAEARANVAEQNKISAAAKQAEAQSAHASAQKGWQAVLLSGGLKPELDPPGAAGMFGTIGSAMKQQKSIESLRDRVQKMRETISDIEARLASVLAEAHLPGFQTGLALTAMEDLQTRYTEHQRALESVGRIEEEMKEWIRGRDPLVAQQRHVQAKRAALFAAAAANDEQEFRATGAGVARRKELMAGLENLTIAHPMLVNETGRPYMEELATLTFEEMQPRLETLKEEEQKQEENLNNLNRELGQLAGQKRAIEESNPTEELHLALSQKEEGQKEDARRWAVLTLAKDMLETTRGQFQRARQPALLLSASHYFKALTLDRYSRVETVVGENRFEVIEGASRRKAVADLSRGTAEQLYLAMRFALIEEYSRNAEPLPVLMDDVLVNFDPGRARAACAAVLELSTKFQVIFLTCHPQTVAYFQDMVAGAGADSAAPPMLVLELQSSARIP